MKKFRVVFLIISMLLIFNSCENDSTTESKTSDGRGACSSHKGVNCSAGADSDGSVICNDGWLNSSVSFSSVLIS